MEVEAEEDVHRHLRSVGWAAAWGSLVGAACLLGDLEKGVEGCWCCYAEVRTKVLVEVGARLRR